MTKEADDGIIAAMVPRTIRLENGLVATIRNCEDPTLNSIREKVFLGEKDPHIDYCYVASVQLDDETIHILLWACTAPRLFRQVLHELRTNLAVVPRRYPFIGVGYEVNHQVQLYFWNTINNPRPKWLKSARMIWAALMKKTKPSIQVLLRG